MTTPLLLLHGAIGAKSQFEPLAAALPPSFDVHLLDFEGHGEAPDADRPFRTAYFIENVLSYLEEHGLEQVDIFGHSMGGYVGLALAASHPNKVRKIMTLGVKFDWTPEFSAQEVGNFNPDKILEKVPHFAEMLQARHGEERWRENLKKSAECTLDLGNSPVVTPELLATIEHPVLISLGDRDNLTTLEESARTANILPNGALQLLPKTRHPLEMIDVSMVAAAIQQFLLT